MVFHIVTLITVTTLLLTPVSINLDIKLKPNHVSLTSPLPWFLANDEKCLTRKFKHPLH